LAVGEGLLEELAAVVGFGVGVRVAGSVGPAGLLKAGQCLTEVGRVGQTGLDAVDELPVGVRVGQFGEELVDSAGDVFAEGGGQDLGADFGERVVAEAGEPYVDPARAAMIRPLGCPRCSMSSAPAASARTCGAGSWWSASVNRSSVAFKTGSGGASSSSVKRFAQRRRAIARTLGSGWDTRGWSRPGWVPSSMANGDNAATIRSGG